MAAAVVLLLLVAVLSSEMEVSYLPPAADGAVGVGQQ